MKYRRNDIEADANARGWNLLALFNVAGVNRWTGYSFMGGKSNSPDIAAKLTTALGRKPGFYQVRKPRPSRRAVA
jgi:hypothetical protein